MTLEEFEKIIEPCQTTYRKSFKAKVKHPDTGKDYTLTAVDSREDGIKVSERELKTQLKNMAIELGIIQLQ